MSDWNTKVIEEFRANGGKVAQFGDAPMIVLHAIGAKSGAVRQIPLVSFPQEDGTLVIASSAAGAPNNPDWYYNIKAHPHFDVEFGTETFAVDAVEIAGAERDAVWGRVVEAVPGFGDYEKKTTRVIPLWRLTRS